MHPIACACVSEGEFNFGEQERKLSEMRGFHVQIKCCKCCLGHGCVCVRPIVCGVAYLTLCVQC